MGGRVGGPGGGHVEFPVGGGVSGVAGVAVADGGEGPFEVAAYPLPQSGDVAGQGFEGVGEDLLLTDAGITIKRPPSAAERPGVTAATLAAEHGTLRPAPATADAEDIAARIAVERGSALLAPAPAEPQPVPSPTTGSTLPAQKKSASPTFLQRVFRRGR